MHLVHIKGATRQDDSTHLLSYGGLQMPSIGDFVLFVEGRLRSAGPIRGWVVNALVTTFFNVFNCTHTRYRCLSLSDLQILILFSNLDLGQVIYVGHDGVINAGDTSGHDSRSQDILIAAPRRAQCSCVHATPILDVGKYRLDRVKIRTAWP